MSEEEQKHLQQSYYDLHEKYYKQKEEIEGLNKYNEHLVKIINSLEELLLMKINIIDKAIEYIEENCGADNRLQLKIILQGNDKE